MKEGVLIPDEDEDEDGNGGVSEREDADETKESVDDFVVEEVFDAVPANVLLLEPVHELEDYSKLEI